MGVTILRGRAVRPLPIETFSGTHYEMGVQHGRAFRHAVYAAAANTRRHDFEESDAELDEGLRGVRASNLAFAPWLEEELRGIAEGRGVDYAVIERLHLRVWNNVPRARRAAPAGTSMGMRTADACQFLGGFEPVVQDADAPGGMVFSTNHIHMPALLERLAQAGCQPDIAGHSAVRFAAVARARDRLPRTLAAFQAILRSHDGYPHSVCRDATAFSTFCLPQRMPTVFTLADRPPCRQAFYEYPIRGAFESGKMPV